MKNRLLFCVFILILLTFSGMQVYSLHNYGATFEINDDPLIEAIDHTVSLSKETTTKVITCSTQPCELTLDLSELTKQILLVEHLIANEKKSVSTVGISVFQMSLLSIYRYQDNTDNARLLQEFIIHIGEMEALSSNLTRIKLNLYNEAQNSTQQRLYIQLAISLLTALVIVLGLFRHLERTKNEQARLEKSLQAMSAYCANNEVEEILLHTTESEITGIERNIYSAFNRLLVEVELSRKNTDLYRQLYGFIGYEIRGITNTINGGVKLLIQETDESGVVLAKDITTATDSLSDLADNYNNLLSVGGNDTGLSIDVAKIFIGLGVNLSHKVKETGGSFDCYLPPGIPEYTAGNYTKIFWSLLLSFSNAIQSIEHDSTLLTCTLKQSDNIESIRLSFELVFLNSNKMSFEAIETTEWGPTADSFSMNNAAIQLIDQKHSPSLIWLQSDIGHKVSLSIETTPKRYLQTSTEFENRRVLACGDDNIQTSIITRVLEDLKIITNVVRTPNEIFRTLKEEHHYDAIIISDTMNGIKLRSFCKTLKSRLAKVGNTKLILSISDPQPFEEGYEMVDKIIQHPFTTTEFSQKIEQLFAEMEDDEVAESHPLLIVEDDKVQQFILKTMLTKQGYECVCVNDGLAAVKTVQDANFEIIFMDCIMPGLDGFEATKRIRQLEADERVGSVTIIGATALSSNSEHKACIEAGMDYVINKPYNAEQIFKVIKKYAALQKIS